MTVGDTCERLCGSSCDRLVWPCRVRVIVRSSLALLHAMVDSPCELRDVRKGLSFLGIALPHALDVNGEPLPVLGGPNFITSLLKFSSSRHDQDGRLGLGLARDSYYLSLLHSLSTCSLLYCYLSLFPYKLQLDRLDRER